MPKKPTPKKKDTSPRIPQRDKVAFNLAIRDFPFTDTQKEFISLALNKETKVVFVEGPAGSAKTLMCVYVALQMLNTKRNGEVIYVRSLAESSEKGMGFLPGLAEEKFAVYATPLMDKLDELLPMGDVKRLTAEGRIRPIPVNYIRGLSMCATTCIVDEAQNNTTRELVSILTRIGEHSKFLIAGDSKQSDLYPEKRGGFAKMITAFDNQESKDNGIFVFRLGKQDIMRSAVLRFIIDRLETTGLV